MSVVTDISTGTVETRISKLWNQEAKSTKTVRRHNTKTRKIKLMVRKYQKFQIFSKKKVTRLLRSQPQSFAITVNCSRRLVQEKFKTSMHRLTTRAHSTISVKQQEQKKHNKAKSVTIKLSRKRHHENSKNVRRRSIQRTG